MHKTKRRRTSEGVLERRAALAIVSPVNRKITHWQAAAVRLRAISARARDRDLGPLLAEVEAIESEVGRHLADLGRAVDADPIVCEVGRVTDTVRALESLQMNLGIARQAFDAR